MTFHTVLVANRGEIAVRVIRTLQRMGIRSVGVYSDADAFAPHVAEADVAVRIGPPPARDSYLNISAIIDAALRTGAQAVHPGYGFLAENSEFAAALDAAGIAFIGPPTAAIRTMGDKIAAKAAVAPFGVPVVPGVARPGMTDAELIEAAEEVGYPVIVKPSAGGGGKGMRVAYEPSEMPDVLVSARRESASAFGDDTLFLERYVTRPRHIEVQVLADQYGNVVHFGERECSLQRRHQKVIEEAPSPLLDRATRAQIGAAACDVARSVEYIGAGTVEFIVSTDSPDEFFFLEMNTRLQVEHPVTEMVTGWDFVEWQVRVAAGEKLPVAQEDIALHGHAIEARVYAEDPAHGFLPTGGRVLHLVQPDDLLETPGIRVDSGLAAGLVVGSDYDPMLAKVTAHGSDRATALRLLDRALLHTAVPGVVTNVEFLRFILNDPDVVAGRLDTGLLDRRVQDFTAADATDEALIAAATYRWVEAWSGATDDLWTHPSGWRVGNHIPKAIRLQGVERTEHVYISGHPSNATARVENGETHSLTAGLDDSTLAITLDGLRREYVVATDDDDRIWLTGAEGTVVIAEVPEPAVRGAEEHSGDAELTSPMPGTVVAVGVESASEVTVGTVVVTVEAMKMEHPLTAPVDGIVEVLVAVGDQVKVGEPLARIAAHPKEEV